MKLNKTATYAITATLILARYNDKPPVSCRKLALEGGMPERFLLGILRSLVSRGILASYRGVDGGYKLARDPSSLSVLDVVEAIEGRLAYDDSQCRSFPEDMRKPLSDVFENISRSARMQLQSLKLSDIINAVSETRPQRIKMHASIA